MMNRTHGKTLAAAVLLGTLALAAPARAQVDLTGGWADRLHEDWIDRLHGPYPVDFTGIPFNEDGRARGLSYSSSLMSMPERQCMQYPADYVVVGFQPIQIWSEDEPVTGRLISWNISGAGDRDPLTIWMDGRPHPSPNALHTFSGFSTGVWEGDVLTVQTTHLKAGPLRRNGAPSSDQTTLSWHLVRHGDLLTITTIIDDPVYLAEPDVLSRTWQLNTQQQLNHYFGPCWPAVEVARLGRSGKESVAVPHYLPGQNPYLDEFRKTHNLPLEAVLGGPSTMYPEYRKTLKDSYTSPHGCFFNCCGWYVTSGIPGNNDAPGLNCNINGISPVFR